jgi:hypothetical protein
MSVSRPPGHRPRTATVIELRPISGSRSDNGITELAQRLNAELRDKEGEIGQLFPHVYGALNVPAVVKVRALS